MAEILWAEDSEGDQALIEAALLALGSAHRISFVGDGEQFVRRARERPYSLGVLDIQMPVMGGLEVLESLQGARGPAPFPIVVFTSTTRPQEMAACRKLGATDVLTKPMDFERFQGSVASILARLPPA